MNAFCSGCGKAIANDQILYTETAQIVCPRCNGQNDVVAANMNVGHKIRNAAITSAALGAIGWGFDPVFILSIMAAASGLYALTSLGRTDEQFRISQDRGMILGLSILGLLLVGIKLLAFYVILSR